MAYTAILPIEECRDAQRRPEVRQRLHDRFDRWLQRVEEEVKEPEPTFLVYSQRRNEWRRQCRRWWM